MTKFQGMVSDVAVWLVIVNEITHNGISLNRYISKPPGLPLCSRWVTVLDGALFPEGTGFNGISYFS